MVDDEQDNSSPKDFILDTDLEIPLFNIYNRLKRSEKIQKNLLEIQIKNQEILGNIEKAQLRNESILGNIEKAQLRNENIFTEILKLERARTDEGKNIVKNNLLIKVNAFTKVDMLRDPGHLVKSAFIKNDGPNSIFVAYNASMEGIDPTIEDVTSDMSRFIKLNKGEDKKWYFNERSIYVIHITVDPGLIKTNPNAVSTCRLEVAW